jgi:hypothetical protein
MKNYQSICCEFEFLDQLSSKAVNGSIPVAKLSSR